MLPGSSLQQPITVSCSLRLLAAAVSNCVCSGTAASAPKHKQMLANISTVYTAVVKQLLFILWSDTQCLDNLHKLCKNCTGKIGFGLSLQVVSKVQCLSREVNEEPLYLKVDNLFEEKHLIQNTCRYQALLVREKTYVFLLKKKRSMTKS